MAKRFTDTDKWKKVWFRKLKPVYKCFWEYLRDNCNNAGIWEVDFELASFQIGAKLNQNEVERAFSKQFVRINGSKWFLIDFIDWQYNCSIENLNPKNNAHLSAIRILEKFNIYEVLARAHSAPMDKDKDKEEDKNKDKDKKLIDPFIIFWTLYDKRVSKSKAEPLWNKLTDEERRLVVNYIPEYIESQPDKAFRKNPDVFLRNRAWEDEIVTKKKDNRGTRRQGVTLTKEQREQYR